MKEDEIKFNNNLQEIKIEHNNNMDLLNLKYKKKMDEIKQNYYFDINNQAAPAYMNYVYDPVTNSYLIQY